MGNAPLSPAAPAVNRFCRIGDDPPTGSLTYHFRVVCFLSRPVVLVCLSGYLLLFSQIALAAPSSPETQAAKSPKVIFERGLLSVETINQKASVGGNELFIDATPSAQVLAQQEKDKQNPTIKRDRYVQIKLKLIRSQEGRLFLNLFDDVLLTAANDRIEVRAENRFTWYGHVEEVEHSQVILVVEEGSMAGDIIAEKDIYQIRDIGGGIHAIYEIDQSAFPPHADPIPVP